MCKCLTNTIITRSDQIDEPLEIGFVSWPMVRYRREVLFGWVDLLGESQKLLNKYLFLLFTIILHSYSCFWRHCWSIFGFQFTEWSGNHILLHVKSILHGGK